MTDARRAAAFMLSPDGLKKALSLPDSAQIYGAEWDWDCMAIRVHVFDVELPPVPEGEAVPTVILIQTITTSEDGGRLVKGRWSQ